MTKNEAYDWVRDTFDDDEPDADTLADAFDAIYGRPAEDDETEAIWSLVASATPGMCGCSTRTQHERGACAA